MSATDAIAAMAFLLSILTALYARQQVGLARQQVKSAQEQVVIATEQARSAKEQVTEAARQVTEMQEANRIAQAGLELQQRELQERQRVQFAFQPGHDPHGVAVLYLKNDSPHDMYVLSIQLYGPNVNQPFGGKIIRDVSQVGGEPFIRARDAQVVLRHDLSQDNDLDEIMPWGKSIEFRLKVKVNGQIYEIESKLSLSESGHFSTLGTKQKLIS